jgi:acyl-CoA thioester hydrolase
MREPGRYPVRVYHEDTDFTGMVYHGQYVRFFERARTEYLRAAGENHTELLESGLMLVVHAMEVKFLAPARIDDLLSIETYVSSLTGARMIMDQRAFRDQTPIATALVTVVMIDGAGRPQRIAEHLPESFRAG